MKDPCEDNCILRVVCTEECDKKINYGVLLKNAVEQNTVFKRTSMGARRITGRHDNCYKYVKELDKYASDITEIRKRKKQKEGENV